MPQVTIAPAALRDIQRLREFLATKDPSAAKRAAKAIIKGIQLLGMQPQIGRPVEGLGAEFRELPIHFGTTGYVARYHFAGDSVTVLAVRHQKEAGF
jgi:plasmid stabilization system protein ParE